MNARFLLLPALALFVGLSGCDAGSPTGELQVSPTVPTASAITGPASLAYACSGTYVSSNSGGTGSYFIDTSGQSTITPLSITSALVTRTGTGKITLEYRRASGTVLFDLVIGYDDTASCA
jgi:hypothetical protein